MAKFKRYDSYKNSGVEWLGQIPSHWEMVKFKHLFYEKRKTYDINLNCGSISFGNIVEKDDEKIPLSTKASYQVLNKGEFLINPLNLNYDLKSLRIGLSNLDVVVSSGYIVIKNKVDINKKYFNYLLHIYDILFMKILGAGVRQTLNFNDIGKTLLVIPPKDEQEKIASYLDEKIAKINTAISGKEKLIELLKEQKQIIINDAVTKGLNKNAKFKNSGVEWLGEIPSHWEILKLKFIGKIFAGLSDKKGDDFSKEFTNDKKPFIPFTNVCNNLKIDKNQMQYVKINPYETQNKVREKDIIFLMSSETLEDIGKCSIYLEKEQLYLNSFCKGFRPNLSRINAEFLNYLLQSKTYRNYFNLAGRGFTRINIKQEYISNLCAILPPKDEQEKIVEYIENKISKIDKLLNLEQECIKSLKEYKASLIDSVVTGKVKV